MVLKMLIFILSLLSLMWFPWPLTVLMMCLSGLAFPPFALFLGALAELMYGVSGFPVAFTIGLSIMLVSYAVRVFVKTRII
jgi:hypothetical protein